MPLAGEPLEDERSIGAVTVPATPAPVLPTPAEAWWADFRTAFSALTIFGRAADVAKLPIGSSALFYPVVGALIGLVACILDGLFRTFLSQEIASVLLVGMLVLLSAGRQLDGFANTADGVIGFRGREWAIATMRDRRLGTSGVAAIFFLLTVKVRAVDLISEPMRFAGILLPPMIGRWALVALAHGARAAGDPARFDATITVREVVVASAFGTLLTLALGGALGLLVLVVGVITAASLRVYFDRRLGGVTMQTLDACAELLESVALVLFALGA